MVADAIEAHGRLAGEVARNPHLFVNTDAWTFVFDDDKKKLLASLQVLSLAASATTHQQKWC